MSGLHRCIMSLVLVMFASKPIEASLTNSAMTTVLARPLGGYGLTPLVFEQNSLASFLGLGSSAVETKVRKSPVYELLMPNFDDEPTSALGPVQRKPKAMKKLDYESLVSSTSKINQDKALNSAPSNSYYSGNDIFSMFGRSNNFDNMMPGYNEPMGDKSSFKTVHNTNSYDTGSHDSYAPQAPITAAIQSMRSVEVKPVQETGYQNNEPQVIDIPPSGLPIVINFRTSSSQIQVHQTHEPAERGEVQQTQSEEEPHYLKHSVLKPVIQELHEIIVPKRNIIQEILPVEEEVKTIVARGKPRNKGYSGKAKARGLAGGSNGYAVAASSASAKKALPASAKYKS